MVKVPRDLSIKKMWLLTLANDDMVSLKLVNKKHYVYM